MRKWNTDALVFLKGDLKLNVKVKESGMIDKLEIPQPLAFLNRAEMQTVKSMATDMDRMDKIIDFLLGKEDKCFSNFCNILEASNNKTWAVSLRKKAEEFKGGPGKCL